MKNENTSPTKIVTLTDESYAAPLAIAVRLYVETGGTTVACRYINLTDAEMDNGDDVIGAVWVDSDRPLGVGWSVGIAEFAAETSHRLSVDLIAEARAMLLG